MDSEAIKPIIEAALFAADEALSIKQLLDLFADTMQPGVKRETIIETLAELQAECDGRGIELVEVASGFRYQVRQDIHPKIRRLWAQRPSRYSRALLETLALVAYRQPITRGEIEQVRGVSVSSQIIRTMEERGWIKVIGHRETPGRPAIYGTTQAFLDYFNLKTLAELPPLNAVMALGEDMQASFPDAVIDSAVPTSDTPSATPDIRQD